MLESAVRTYVRSAAPFNAVETWKALILAVVWSHKVDMTNSQGLRKFVQSDHSWISLASLKTTEILLADTRTLRDRLLRQSLLLT